MGAAFDSVGSLLADIAHLLADGLRILSLADKRHWGPDEHEQARALDDALDDARKDFQELSPLVHGQAHYQHDRKHESLEELRALRARFGALVQSLKDWTRCGGPINPVWVRDTHTLQRDLHRAQCRAARRIYTSDHESSRRCLGARIVRSAAPPPPARPEAACAAAGAFERFGDADVAFICDFCDGHLVWHHLETVPMPAPAPAPPWLATATAASGLCERHVVAALLAVANHMPPLHGDWQARLLCPYCDEAAQLPLDDDDDDDDDDDNAAYRPDDEFDDLAALYEHLEWQHPGSAPPATLPLSLPSASKCLLM